MFWAGLVGIGRVQLSPGQGHSFDVATVHEPSEDCLEFPLGVLGAFLRRVEATEQLVEQDERFVLLDFLQLFQYT